MPFWPAAGFAIAISYRFNKKVFFGLFLGAFLANAITLKAGYSLSALIGIVNSLSPIMAVYCINILIKKRNPFNNIYDFAIFFLIAVVLHPAITAFGGVFGKLLFGTIQKENLLISLQSWWLAHAAGTILFAPIIFLILFPERKQISKKYEFLFVSLATIFCTFITFAFMSKYRTELSYILIIPMSFAALRYSMFRAIFLLTLFVITGMLGIILNQINTSGDLLHIHAFRIMAISYTMVLFLISIIKKMQKNTEDELSKTKEKYRLLVDYSQRIIYTIDNNGIFTFVSPSWTKLLGYEKYETIGQSFNIFIYKDDISYCKQEFLKAVKTKKIEFNSIEYRVIHKDGSICWHRSVFQAVLSENNELSMFVGNAIDITKNKKAEEESKKLQDKLNQAQKMESVGRLAGGVAHDFNNMLGVILGHTELCLNKVYEKDPIFFSMQEIYKAAFRSAELTKQLLAFARKQTIAPKVININKIIENTFHMLQRLIGENIILKWYPYDNIWSVKMDPSQIDQILANLCVNSRDAIINTGEIIIETNQITVDKYYISSHQGLIEGDYVLLIVSDNGCGMTKETAALMFEPFFTTKGMNKGTGLGLSTVYGIVKQNNGFIDVYSEKEKGTTFKIYLPRYTENNISSTLTNDELINLKGHETILIVEDEPMILDIAKTMLQQNGYNILCSKTPNEAILTAKNYKNEIHLLLTDVIMPEMNGRELNQKLITYYPNIKCLFMSGYTANVIAHHGVLKEGVNFIQKPFSMKDLTLSVKKSLENN